jgi:hypothetical protein
MPVVDIVKIIEDITGLSLRYNLVNCGQPVSIDIEKIRTLNIEFDSFHPKYLENILRNFYHCSGLIT